MSCRSGLFERHCVRAEQLLGIVFGRGNAALRARVGRQDREGRARNDLGASYDRGRRHRHRDHLVRRDSVARPRRCRDRDYGSARPNHVVVGEVGLHLGIPAGRLSACGDEPVDQGRRERVVGADRRIPGVTRERDHECLAAGDDLGLERVRDHAAAEAGHGATAPDEDHLAVGRVLLGAGRAVAEAAQADASGLRGVAGVPAGAVLRRLSEAGAAPAAAGAIAGPVAAVQGAAGSAVTAPERAPGGPAGPAAAGDDNLGGGLVIRDDRCSARTAAVQGVTTTTTAPLAVTAIERGVAVAAGASSARPGAIATPAAERTVSTRVAPGPA